MQLCIICFGRHIQRPAHTSRLKWCGKLCAPRLQKSLRVCQQLKEGPGYWI